MLQIKNTLGGGKSSAPYAWAKYEVIPDEILTNPSIDLSYVQSSGRINITGANFDLSFLPSVTNSNGLSLNGTDDEKQVVDFFTGFQIATNQYKLYLSNDVLMFYFEAGALAITEFHNDTDGTWFTVDVYSAYGSFEKTLPFTGEKIGRRSYRNFIEYITDKSPTKYPNGEVHTDGYFYRYAPEGQHSWYKYAKSKTPTIIREALEKAPYYFVNGEMLVYHDEIHILGGNSNTKKTHYKYDGSSWTLISTLPGNVSYYKSNTDKFFVYNDKICAINSAENILHEWDEENGWVSNGYCAEATHVLTTQCVYNGKVYFLGSGSSNFYSQLNVLDGHTWSKFSNALPLNYTGYRDSAVVWRGEMYIFGGYSSGNSIYKYNGDTWTNVDTSPDSNPMIVLVYEDKIYVIGYSGQTKVLSVWDGITWTTLTTETYPFTGCGACVYSDEIYLVGGSDSNVSLRFLRYIGKTYSEFKGYVVDELISKYPEDDILNGYLYKKVSELDVFEVNGKIIPSSDLYNITLNIGAGNSLVLVNIYGSASSSYAQQVIYGIYGGYRGKIYFSPDTSSYQFSVKDNGDGTVSIGNSQYPFKSGVTYTWSALVRKKV